MPLRHATEHMYKAFNLKDFHTCNKPKWHPLNYVIFSQKDSSWHNVNGQKMLNTTDGEVHTLNKLASRSFCELQNNQLIVNTSRMEWNFQTRLARSKLICQNPTYTSRRLLSMSNFLSSRAILIATWLGICKQNTMIR